MICKICSSGSDHFGVTTVLGKYDVNYYRCGLCGFIQTEEPYWLTEAYSEAIALSDVGLVDRNIRLSRVSAVILSTFFDADKTFLDFGGGYGLFTRLMRDAGFDFRHYDKYSHNLLACGFEADPAATVKYEALTAFEVFEHLADPMSEIEEMLAFSRNIIFTTELVPPQAPLPGTWWYYGARHGQHVSFYTRETLDSIARKFSLRVYSNGRFLHLLTDKKLSPSLFRVMARPRLAPFATFLAPRKSLLAEDYRSLETSDIFNSR